MPYTSVVISSGHGKYVRGAAGILDEVDEARRIVDAVVPLLVMQGVTAIGFHDDTSHSQDENLRTIVNFHNKQQRQLDVSVHLNAFEQTSKPMGTEVLYVSQPDLAGQMSAAIASNGFINRGAKKNTGLYFLNNTDEPAILLEICFVDSSADAEIYDKKFTAICDAIVSTISGVTEIGVPPPQIPVGRVEIEISGNVHLTLNGKLVEL